MVYRGMKTAEYPCSALTMRITADTKRELLSYLEQHGYGSKMTVTKDIDRLAFVTVYGNISDAVALDATVKTLNRKQFTLKVEQHRREGWAG